MVDIGEAFRFGSEGIRNKPGYGSLGELISSLLPNVYVIASVILLFLLLAGGFVIIMNAGNPEKQANGNKAITAAIAGFVIIFVSSSGIFPFDTISLPTCFKAS